MKKFIVFFLMLLISIPAYATKRESSSLDARSVVLYGKDGNDLVPLKVDSDGSISGVGGGLWTEGASDAIYYNDGNVGIGTSAPSAELEVVGKILSGSIDNMFLANHYSGATGGEKIQAAITAAHAAGDYAVVAVIGDNDDSVDGKWNLNEAVLLPSNTTLFLYNCKLFLNDDAEDNIFRNSDIVNGNTNISIIGLGNVDLDGNGENQNRPNSTLYKDPKWQGIRFVKVDNLNYSGFTIRDTAAWAIKNEDVTNVNIKDIEIISDIGYINNDGVHNVGPIDGLSISNMKIKSHDDGIILTALDSDSTSDFIEYNGGNIKNVRISNVEISNYCGIKVLVGDGYDIHDVTIDNAILHDLPYGGIKFIPYQGSDAPTRGVYNLTIDNIICNNVDGEPCVGFNVPVDNVNIGKVTSENSNSHVVYLNSVNSNISIGNIIANEVAKSALAINNDTKNLTVQGITVKENTATNTDEEVVNFTDGTISDVYIGNILIDEDRETKARIALASLADATVSNLNVNSIIINGAAKLFNFAGDASGIVNGIVKSNITDTSYDNKSNVYVIDYVGPDLLLDEVKISSTNYNLLSLNKEDKTNIIIGYGAGNTTMGETATQSTHATDLIGIGSKVFNDNTIGSNNIAIGRSSLENNTEGYNNVGLGYITLQENTTGYSNLAIGLGALSDSITGIDNTAVGVGSLIALTSGSENVSIGRSAGRYLANGTSTYTTSNQNVFIGNKTKSSANDQTNQIVIGYDAIGNGSNSVTLGADTITKTVLRGSVGIGNTAPTSALDVTGTATMTGFKLSTSPTSGYVLTSDADGVGTWQEAASASGAINWDDIGGLQSDINVSGFTNDAGFVTSLDTITEGDTSAEVVDTGSDGHFKVTTEGTERLRVLSSGRVGIGTSAPDSSLELKAASDYTTFYVTGNTAKVVLSTAYNSGAIGTVTNDEFVIKQNDTTVMTINTSKNVGIGTAPSDKLHVAGTIRSTDSGGGKILLQDTDASGYTLCTALNGTLTCCVDDNADDSCD